MRQRLEATFHQKLHLSAALQQSLHLLQLPQAELSEWLMNETENNPLLQISSFPQKERFEKEIEAPFNPYEEIQKQIREFFLDPQERKRAFEIFSELDERGFLPDSFPQEKVLSLLQTFDPPGIFARSHQECFLLQLERKGLKNSMCYLLVSHHYQDLLHKRFSLIQKKLRLPHLQPVLKQLSKLSLRPLENMQKEINPPISPDLIFENLNDRWHVHLAEDELPSLKIETKYFELKEKDKEEKELLQGLKTKARWIFRSLHRRRTLLQKIGTLILEKQTPFLEQKGPFQPLSLKQVAAKLEIHESTLSRALFSKYAATPRGIFSLKDLLTQDTSSLSTQELLEKLIHAEDKNNPLTDEELSRALQERGICIARRTIAKYRSKSKIGSAQQRKVLSLPNHSS